MHTWMIRILICCWLSWTGLIRCTRLCSCFSIQSQLMNRPATSLSSPQDQISIPSSIEISILITNTSNVLHQTSTHMYLYYVCYAIPIISNNCTTPIKQCAPKVHLLLIHYSLNHSLIKFDQLGVCVLTLIVLYWVMKVLMY